MARYSVTMLTSAGSATLPLASLYATTNSRCWITKLSVFNTTATAFSLRLVRLTTLGTQGATVTPTLLDETDSAAYSIAYNTHTAAPTISTQVARYVLGAGIGSGVIDTWQDRQFVIAKTANAGVGLVTESGTGQPLTVTIEFGE